jgi:hypothetical protein
MEILHDWIILYWCENINRIAVGIGFNGDIFVSGTTHGNFYSKEDGIAKEGDIFLTKFDANGQAKDVVQFGSNFHDEAR